MADIEIRKQKLATWLKWGGGLVAAAILSPVAFFALKGVVAGGLALLGAWIIGVSVTQVMPALSFILSNWILKVIKWEARRNPIETLQNQLIVKQALLEERKKAIVELDGYVRGFRTKVKGYKEKYPKDAADFEDQLRSFEAVLITQNKNYDTAKRQLELFSDEVERAKSKWEVTMAAQGVSKLTGRFADSVMEKIKQDTALESVELEMNRAFAELDAAVYRGQELTSLPASSQVVELPAIKEKAGSR